MGKSITTVTKMTIDGKELWFPSPIDPGLYEASMPLYSSVDTGKKFPLGTKLTLQDGRVFRYCLANGYCYPQFGCYKAKKTNTVAVAPTQATAAAQLVAYGENIAAGAVGSNYITVTIDTEIGVLTTGVLSANELEGGFVVIGNGVGQYPQFRRIISHPALATTGGSLTLRIDEPIVRAVTAATTTIELMESPYYNISGDSSGGEYVTYFGISSEYVESGEYFWAQTGGLCWPTSNSNTCDSAMDRTIVFVGNGSVVSSNDVTLEDGFQMAGIAFDMSGSAASNAPMTWLMLE